MIHAREAELRTARGALRPRVNAFGAYEYDRGWDFRGSGNYYSTGLLLQWDLFDGKLAAGKISAAQAELDAAREEERKLRLNIDLEIEQARLALADAGERLTVTDQAVAQAAESVTLTRARFEQGIGLSTQLIDAETALTTARVRRAEAEADRRIAIAALRRALGLPQTAN